MSYGALVSTSRPGLRRSPLITHCHMDRYDMTFMCTVYSNVALFVDTFHIRRRYASPVYHSSGLELAELSLEFP